MDENRKSRVRNIALIVLAVAVFLRLCLMILR